MEALSRLVLGEQSPAPCLQAGLSSHNKMCSIAFVRQEHCIRLGAHNINFMDSPSFFKIAIIIYFQFFCNCICRPKENPPSMHFCDQTHAFPYFFLLIHPLQFWVFGCANANSVKCLKEYTHFCENI